MMKNTMIITAFLLVFGLSNFSASAEVDFEKEIWPLFKERCVKCHGSSYKQEKRGRIRTKKAKGGLRLDSGERIMNGVEGEEEGERNPVLVPGKPKDSSLYTALVLPEDDDDVMPPEGKADYFSKEEAELVKAWITEGGKFGDWKGLPEEYDRKKVLGLE